MARSLGDTVAHTVGVSCTPEIKQFSLTERDKILVIASDGLWEFCENSDVLEICKGHYERENPDPENLAKALVAEAR